MLIIDVFMFARIGSRTVQELEQVWANTTDRWLRDRTRVLVGRPSTWDRERTWEQSPSRTSAKGSI